MKLFFSIITLSIFTLSVFSIQNRSVFNRKKSFEIRFKQLSELNEVLPSDNISGEIANLQEIEKEIVKSFTPEGSMSQAGKFLSKGEKKIGIIEKDYVVFIQKDSEDFIKTTFDILVKAEIEKQNKQKEKQQQKIEEGKDKGESEKVIDDKNGSKEKKEEVTEETPADKSESKEEVQEETVNKVESIGTKNIKPRGKPARYLEMAKQEHSTANRFQKSKQYFYAISYYKRSILYSLLAITSSKSDIPEKYKSFYDKWLNKDKETEKNAEDKEKAKEPSTKEKPEADAGTSEDSGENNNSSEEEATTEENEQPSE